MVAAVVAACGALTLTTTAWAADQHRQNLGRQLEGLVMRDVAELRNALAVDPSARTLDALEAAGWRGYEGDDRLPSELLLIPPESGEANHGQSLPVPDPERALVARLVNDWGPVSRTRPECLQRPMRVTLGSPGSTGWWTEPCGRFLISLGVFQPAVGQDQEIPWMVVRTLNLDEQADPVPALQRTLQVRSAFIVVASAMLAFALAGSVIRPISRAGRMAEAVAAGGLSARIPVVGDDDVAAMSRAVNTMADRLTGQIAELERVNEAQRRFVSDVAHELRTPTAALLASAEALRDPATRDEAAALVAPQLVRLSALTEDLLEISRMDAGRAPVVTSRIDLVDLIAEVIGDAGVEIVYTGPSELPLTTDPVRARTVVRNLVANAVQHGEPPVVVGLVCDDARVTVEVHDGGAGVPDALRGRVFDRFVRGDESRHGASSGLGLAIAAENARLLDGSLTLEPDGSTFRLTLPHQPDAEADDLPEAS
ncbi:MAG: HAMP domain-containing sensor histidine kinase [Propioniciclava sp.]|uniref:ATP-binding protein n=1 Tax=Propioniciclava sp. TaxID=2038686 RepID=UPI0039E2946F